MPISGNARLLGEQEGRDARGIGLEGKQHHVKHELDVVAETRRNPVGRFDRRIGRLAVESLGFGDALLDLAHAGEIFIELLLVAAAELFAQAAGVVEDEIQD